MKRKITLIMLTLASCAMLGGCGNVNTTTEQMQQADYTANTVESDSNHKEVIFVQSFFVLYHQKNLLSHLAIQSCQNLETYSSTTPSDSY